jgi:hypothetical protein
LPVDENDPEKRIADLERQLAEAKWTANQQQSQQAWSPPVNWQRPQRARSSSSGWPWALVLRGLGVVFTIGVVLVFGFHFNPFSNAPRQLQTADGMSRLLDEIRKHFGDTMGYQLVVYPDHAIIYRVDPQESRAEKGYFYRAGDWSDWGSSSAPIGGETVADLSKFDPAGVAGQIPKAPQALTITHPKDIYLIDEGRSGGTLALSIYVSGAVDGHMDINPDGSVKQLHPPS